EELEISDNAMAEWIEDGVPLDTLGYLYNLRETEKLAKFLVPRECRILCDLIDNQYKYFGNYYLKYEPSLADNILNPIQKEDYPPIWTKLVKIKQRKIHCEFTSNLNILNGKVLSISDRESGHLHHWESTNPSKNKENCRLSATILLDDSLHGRITIRTVRENKFKKEWQKYYEDKTLYCIVMLLKGKIPKCWNEISNDISNKIRLKENINRLKYLYLEHPKIKNAYNDPNFLSDIEKMYSYKTLLGVSIFDDDLFSRHL
ncbi:MAG: hypothetical protein P8Y97_18920, partial [Candidatus Lokiarchaeota archaeon]